MMLWQERFFFEAFSRACWAGNLNKSLVKHGCVCLMLDWQLACLVPLLAAVPLPSWIGACLYPSQPQRRLVTKRN